MKSGVELEQEVADESEFNVSHESFNPNSLINKIKSLFGVADVEVKDAGSRSPVYMGVDYASRGDYETSFTSSLAFPDQFNNHHVSIDKKEDGYTIECWSCMEEPIHVESGAQLKAIHGLLYSRDCKNVNFSHDYGPD